MIHLVYAATPVYGGWVSFTGHLQLCLQSVGQAPGVVKIARRFEQRQRPFIGAVGYQNLPIEATVPKTVIVALDKAHLDNVRPIISRSWVVMHDPTEVTTESRGLFQSAKGLVVIREKNLALALELNPNTKFIPHPFEAPIVRPTAVPRLLRGVSVSRLDWDKHIDIIAQANAALPAEQRIHIYGAENRLYTHHKLLATDANWRDNYRGAFPRSDLLGGYALARQADFVVDLSAIKGDGGGTQYTFLEAIAAGATLVLNEKWFSGCDASALRPGVNCITVANAEQLAAVMAQPDDEGRALAATAAQAILPSHGYTAIGNEWAKLMEEN